LYHERSNRILLYRDSLQKVLEAHPGLKNQIISKHGCKIDISLFFIVELCSSGWGTELLYYSLILNWEKWNIIAGT
jgi:hypothetical protein